MANHVNHGSKDETLGFDLELTFPAELEAPSDVLLETIVEAIYAYDSLNRLLPGLPMPRNGERIVGSSIALVRREIAPPTVSRSSAGSEPSLGMRISGETLRAMVLMSLRVDEAIEALREAQASLWAVHNELLLAETDAQCRRLEKQADRVAKQIEALLARST